MSTLSWFKSSFSEASGNACIEVAADGGAGIAIRDSGCPAQVITAGRSVFAVFVTFAARAPAPVSARAAPAPVPAHAPGPVPGPGPAVRSGAPRR
ncbi:DUF397 domain-containing protein [Streptomyces sp. NPDC001985]|uniref:DUF397 domain-containing protein n=1 Tax=Streptomyces sp. NPDC001985 TaxID=3154406 RepID=UPI00331BAF52